MPENVIYVKKTVDDLPGGKAICDFCSEPDPVATFPASSFTVSVFTSKGSYTQNYGDDGWAACSWCELLIRAKDVPRLIERYFVVHPMVEGLSPDRRAFVRGLVCAQFDLFFEHWTGEVLPPGPAVTP